MGILVQKFGGTSVASVEKMQQVCNIIENYRKKGYDLGCSILGVKFICLFIHRCIHFTHSFNKLIHSMKKKSCFGYCRSFYITIRILEPVCKFLQKSLMEFIREIKELMN